MIINIVECLRQSTKFKIIINNRRYDRAYRSFKEWCQSKNADIAETLLLTFMEKSETLKSRVSLWSEYSVIKSNLSIEENTDVSKYLKLRAFLKRKNDG